MNQGVLERIRGELTPGERLLWCGRPLGGVRFGGRGGTVATLVSLGAGGSILFVVAYLVTTGKAGGGMIVPLAIVVLILYRVVGHPFVYARRLGRTAYGLTNRRVIVLDDPRDRRRWILPLATLSEIRLRASDDGSGSIDCFSTVHAWNKTTKRGGVLPRPLFRRTVDVRHVHDLLLDAQARATRPRS